MGWWHGGKSKVWRGRIWAVGYNLGNWFVGLGADHRARGLILHVGPLWFSTRVQPTQPPMQQAPRELRSRRKPR